MPGPTMQVEEGEFFVDEAKKPIPPRDTWENLSTNELIDVKVQLEDKLWTFAKNPVIVRSLKEGVSLCEKMIAQRLAP